MSKRLSIVVPVYNESANLVRLYERLTAVTTSLLYDVEFIFINDGSTDESVHVLKTLQRKDKNVRVIEFSRNFGKEAATTAGIHAASGNATILIDADLQHPPEYIPEFVKAWEGGAEVVIGVRNPRHGEGFIRRMGSRTFSRVMNLIGDIDAPIGATDFRLIDRTVAEAFRQMPEHGRLTRALIDWLGFRRVYIRFDANERIGGKNSYSYSKLSGTAVTAVVAHSRIPLTIAGFLGLLITGIAGVLGLFVIVEQILLGDPLGIVVSGTAMLAIMILFLNGIVLIFLGLLSLYTGLIQREAMGRPLYVVRRDSKET